VIEKLWEYVIVFFLQFLNTFLDEEYSKLPVNENTKANSDATKQETKANQIKITKNVITTAKRQKGPNLKKRTAESADEAVKSMRLSYLRKDGPKALQKTSPVNNRIKK